MADTCVSNGVLGENLSVKIGQGLEQIWGSNKFVFWVVLNSHVLNVVKDLPYLRFEVNAKWKSEVSSVSSNVNVAK